MVIVSALPLFYMVGGGNKTTTSTILMSLSQLVGVNNFCFSLLSPFLLIILILSSWAIMFQILLYTILRFPWLTLLPFPVISTSMTSCICELMSRHMTWRYHRRQLWMIISSIFRKTPTLSRRTSINTLSITHPTYHPGHTMLHPT